MGSAERNGKHKFSKSITINQLNPSVIFYVTFSLCHIYRIDGVQHYIGVYDTQEEAANEYYKASKRFGRNQNITESESSSNNTILNDTNLSYTEDSQIPVKLFTALKLKLQLGKITLQLHCEQLHIQDLMAKIDCSTQSISIEHTTVPITGYQETIAIRLNNLHQMQEEQTNLSYQLAMIDLSDISIEELERFGLSILTLEPTSLSSSANVPPVNDQLPLTLNTPDVPVNVPPPIATLATVTFKPSGSNVPALLVNVFVTVRS